MKDSVSLRFLYHTVPGRQVLKTLVRPSVSRKAAKFLSSPASRPLVGYYIRKYDIDLTSCEKTEFASFNDFFTRKKKMNLCVDKTNLISPCDGLLSAYPITDDLRMQIKHSTYSLASLLQDRVLAMQFRSGLCCIFRLEPRHYHRYIYAVSGTIQNQRKIPGILHCVRPITCEEFPVYVQNSRKYTLIRNHALGKVIQMEVGALLVGKIHNYQTDQSVECGAEKGYFEQGFGLGKPVRVTRGFIEDLAGHDLFALFDPDVLGPHKIAMAHGAEDAVIDPAMAARFAEKFHITETVFPGEGHSLSDHPETPDRVVDLAIRLYQEDFPAK